jgi:opacity protein-like surface antigen
MMKRCWLNRVKASSLGFVAGVTLLVGGLASPASAQIVQVTRGDARHSVGFNLGYFALRGEDVRVDGDVLLADLDDLAFEIGDFSGFTFGGEWLYGIGDFIETGVGVGYYQKSVPSLYRNFVDIDGTEIEQDLKLRVLPITATVRFLPIGRAAPVQPYVGAGIGFFTWRYSESGEFVDFSDGTIFRDRYSADGTAVGPVVLGGVRFPVGDAMTTGVEFRWQKAEGDTNSVESGLLGTKIDLGGWTTSWNLHFRF